MSFSLQVTVTPVKQYNSLLGAAIMGTPETLNVVYTVTGISSLIGNAGVASYTVSPEGSAMDGNGIIEFEYSGTGNPLVEAENALQKSLTSVS